MRVSVIITTYNRPRYLQRVMEGYLRQSRLPEQLVIADDGSREETALMVKERAARAKIEVKHVWHEDKGFRAAAVRNKAIAGCSGEYLLLCDDDSIPGPRMVEDHLRYAEEGHFIQGHRVLLGPRISESFTFKDISPWKTLLSSIKGEAGNALNGLRLPLPLIKTSRDLKGIRSCNMSLFRGDIMAVNGFNEDFVGWGKEDSELVVRLYKYGLKRKDLKFRACCYHLHHRHYETENLESNMALLREAEKDDKYRCSNGITKYR
jgi:glycosyltransferase involved in cell wall biosynthesis